MEMSIEVAKGGWVFLLFQMHITVCLNSCWSLGYWDSIVYIYLVAKFYASAEMPAGSGGRFAISTPMVLMSILQVGVTEEVLVASAQIWTVLFFTTGLICEKQLWFERRLTRRAWSGQLARV